MVIVWDDPDAPDHDGERPAVRAAQYVRMSTEHQQYSTDNQAAAIARYAKQRGYVIVRTYADEGKSGLNIGGRAALQHLLADIESGQSDYDAVLVYDVSRWGRFQDPDEAASYELRCRSAGIAVHYCAEQFENDGSIGSSIIKTVKRAMAGEYSRELSVKVFNGQANLIRLGFRQGGSPGFGLRRALIDQSGIRKGELGPGEHKSIQTDRVILVPGPMAELQIVREIYHLFLAEGKNEAEIASILNGRGIEAHPGRQWTRGTVHEVLINEKYIGNNVWAKKSFKLKQRRVRNDENCWVRSDAAFEPIVAIEVFHAAREKITKRSAKLTDDEMLSKLRDILAAKCILTGLIIDEFDDAPSSSSYKCRFGSLLRAYSLVGYRPRQNFDYVRINRELQEVRDCQLQAVRAGIEASGGHSRIDPDNGLLHVNNEFSIHVDVARCIETSSGSLRWKLKLDGTARADLTLGVRMQAGNSAVLDYYLIPRMGLEAALLRLFEHNGLNLDAFRFPTLDHLFEMARRSNLRAAA